MVEPEPRVPPVRVRADVARTRVIDVNLDDITARSSDSNRWQGCVPTACVRYRDAFDACHLVHHPQMVKSSCIVPA